MAKVTRNNPQGFTRLQQAIDDLDGKTVKAGWFPTSKYEDGTSVAYIAAIQEFGANFTRYGSKAGDYSVRIPPRPFMRPTVARDKWEWVRIAAQGARAVLRGATTTNDVMNAIGIKMAAGIAKSISLVTAPALKPSTIKSRLSKRADKKTVGLLDKPLIDSGKMFSEVLNNSVNHKVEKQ